MNVKTSLLIGAIVVIAGLGVAFLFSGVNQEQTISDFESCVKAGNPVLESYPRQCRAGEKNFVEDIGNELEKQDLIRVTYPRPGSIISSPVAIEGEARGYWFFEASFPIELFDADGNKLGIAIAQAQSEWMTENFVPFKATLSFSSSPTSKGMIVFKKDNPSGLPEHDDELLIPVKLQSAPGGVLNNLCHPTGCSGQICSDEDIISTCEYKEEYACYREAICERQAGGLCGWRETPELAACLNSF